MASSNRHWPSMFKSKPCNQWQNDLNSSLMSSGCHRSSPYPSAPNCEERTPEPKPRWNPKPEQIRILEAIFDSGMVNPPREEIRKIRAQLQEYGQVGDANVFYWFQNRKSRSKHKLRHLQNSKRNTQNPNPNPNPNSLMSSSTNATPTPPPSSSSSSSDKSSPSSSHKTNLSLNSPTCSVNQTYFQHHNPTQAGDFMNEPSGFLFPPQHGMIPPFSEVQNIGPCTSLLLNEMMMINNMSTNPNNHNNNNNNNHSAHGGSEKINIAQSDHEKFVKLLQMQKNPLGLINTALSTQSTHSTVTSITTSVGLPAFASNTSQIQGEAEAGSLGPASGSSAAKLTVFINDVVFEVPVGPFNLREAFGEGAVLINAASGQPVLTNEWGLTVHALQHGAFYYLI